jgi:Short C-terminal domain
MEGAGCWVVVIVVVVIVILVVVANRQALEKAKAAYHASLADLSADPTNTTLHQKTLELGRAYSNLTRNQKGVTLFDEVALMNDINAACGAKVSLADSTSPKRIPEPVEQRLQKLAQLKQSGLIDDQEYSAKRSRILDEI